MSTCFTSVLVLPLVWCVAVSASAAAVQVPTPPCAVPTAQQRIFRDGTSDPRQSPPVVGDAPPVGAPMAGVVPVPAGSESPTLPATSVLYRISLKSAGGAVASGAVASIAGISAQSAFSLAAYDCAGNPISATSLPAAEQQLFLAGGTEGSLEVTWENPRSDRTGDFALEMRSSDGDLKDGGLARGYVHRRALRGNDYQHLLDFGQCEQASAGSIGCTARCPATCMEDVYNLVQNATPSAVATAAEPVVAFLGIAGLNRFVLLDRHSGKPTQPDYRSLGRARYFWVLYLEDASVPFQTSFDVEFKARATVGDFDEFDPAGLVNTAQRTDRSSYRIVQFGMKRFKVRPPPVDIEVTLSRQGPTYGLRQWRRAYRVYGLKPVLLSGGIFVPATEVLLDRHWVAERAPASDVLPFDSIVVKEQTRRPIFLTMSLSWTQRRAKADNATNWGEQVLWRAIPEIVGGVGLPPALTPVWYVGGSWPIAWNRVSFTGGVVLIRQERLKTEYHVGQRLAINTDAQREVVNQSLVDRKLVRTVTLGVAVDLVRSR